MTGQNTATGIDPSGPARHPHPTTVIIPAPQAFDDANPRYMCCGHGVERLTFWLAIVQIILAALILIITLSVTGAKAPRALPSVAVTLVMYTIVKVVIVALAIVGVKKEKHQFLIAHLLCQGLEIGLAFVGMLVSLLILFGFTALFGIVVGSLKGSTGSQGVPVVDGTRDLASIPDVDYGTPRPDYDETPKQIGDRHESVQQSSLRMVDVTGIFVAAIILLIALASFGVFCFIVVLKCYRLIRDRVYHAYLQKNSQAFVNEVGPGGNIGEFDLEGENGVGKRQNFSSIMSPPMIITMTASPRSKNTEKPPAYSKEGVELMSTIN